MTDPSVFYALRLGLSGALALYAAYYLQLDNPSSALVTTIIVASPVRGAILSKSFWRFLGTLAGCFAAIMMVALFAQSPLLYLSSFAVWTGFCSYLSNLLRYFRAYSAALAGYTIALIGFGGVIENPNTIFTVALDRLSVVSLGILCSAVVTMLLQPATSQSRLETEAIETLRDVLALLRLVKDGASEETVLDTRRQVSFRIAAYDQKVEFGAAESSEVARRAHALRQLFGILFSLGIGGMRITERLTALEQNPDTQTDAAALRGMLAYLSGFTPHDVRDLSRLAAASSYVRVELRAMRARTVSLKTLGMIEILDDIAQQLRLASRLANPSVSRVRRIKLPPWRDHATAMRSGLRAFLAAEMLGLFWIYTEWPNGGNALLLTAIVVALSATSDSPSAMTMAFLRGTGIACVLSFVCVYGVLVNVDGFPLLLLGYMPVIIVGGYFQTKPRYASLAVATMLFFAVLSPVSNPIHFDIEAFLNSAFGSIAGALAAVIAFMVLVPPSAAISIRQATQSLWRAVGQAARMTRPESELTWEYPQYQKLMRISVRLPEPGRERRQIGRGSAALILAGREMFKIRKILDEGEIPQPARQAVRKMLRALYWNPQRARKAIETAMEKVQSAQQTPHALSIAASLDELHMLLLEGAEKVRQS